MRFFTEYRQRDWPKWLVTAEFVVNNKVYSSTNFAKRMRKVQEKARVILRKVQEEMKRQADKEQRRSGRIEER